MANKFGLLGPLIHPEHYPDPRIAACPDDWVIYLWKLCDERPDFRWTPLTWEQVETMH
jgi:hypothetical protein